jgi:hypothetical protein
MLYYNLNILLLGDTSPMVSQATQEDIICKSYASGKLTYQLTILGFQKTISISSFRVMFRVNLMKRNGLQPIHFFTPQLSLFKGLSSNPNGDHMQKLRPQEGDLATYHFGVHKIVCISNLGVTFRVHYIQSHGVGPLIYFNFL